MNKQKISFLGLCFLLIFTLSGCYTVSNNSMKFDQDKWAEASIIDDNVRKNMAQDLVDGEILIGKSKEDVIKMLGTPENFSDADNNKLYYTVEHIYKWNDIDPIKIINLIVVLDSKEKVTYVYIN